MVILTNVTFFDSKQKKMCHSSAIKIEGELIKEIYYNIEPEPEENDITIDCSNLFAIPGLIDAHIHFFQSSGLYTRPDILDLTNHVPYSEEINNIKKSLPDTFKRYLVSGVTAVVDCGGPFWNFEVRELAGNSHSPHVQVTGPLVSTVSREKLDLGDPPIIQAQSEEHAKELVRKCAEHNPVFIKIWFIYRPQHFENDCKIIAAAINESHALGYRAAVHATELKTAKEALKQGADILVHGVFDQHIDQEFIDLAKNAICIPTLQVRQGYRDVFAGTKNTSMFEEKWGCPRAISSWFDLFSIQALPLDENKENDDFSPLVSNAMHNLKKLHENGITIATGTDAGNIGTLHGVSIHEEMRIMNIAGMSPEDVLQATTYNAAKVFGNKLIGEIKKGAFADLVLLRRNPLNDITATTSIELVISKGNVFSPEFLISPFHPIELVEKFISCLIKKEIDRAMEFVHPKIIVYDLTSNKMLFQGQDQTRKQLRDTIPKLTNLSIKSTIALKNLILQKITSQEGNFTCYYEIKSQRISAAWISIG